MYEGLKTVVATLIMPLPMLTGLALLGALLLASGRRRLGGRLVAGSVLLLVLLAMAPVADRLLEPFEWQHPALTALPRDPPVAAVLVLGSAWSPKLPAPAVTRLDQSAALRLLEGLRLIRQAPPETVLVFSGASRQGDTTPIAHGYRAAAIELGIPAARIVVLDTPLDTSGEALAMRQWLRERGRPDARFALVTSASHMPRAMRHFQGAGLAPIAAPTEFMTGRGGAGNARYWVPSPQNLRKTERAWYEFLGGITAGFELPDE